MWIKRLTRDVELDRRMITILTDLSLYISHHMQNLDKKFIYSPVRSKTSSIKSQGREI